jgi:hypothetical protein
MFCMSNRTSGYYRSQLCLGSEHGQCQCRRLMALEGNEHLGIAAKRGRDSAYTTVGIQGISSRPLCLPGGNLHLS